jgi:signal transduction histidine kinase
LEIFNPFRLGLNYFLRILETNFYRLKTVRLILFLILGFVLVSNISRAQKSIDSLENILKQNPPDSLRIRVLINLSEKYEYVTFAKSRAYAEEALKIANQRNLLPEKILAHQTMGSLHTLAGDYTTALKYDNQALQMSLALKDSVLIANDYNFIANDYYDLGEYDEAYFYFITSYRIAQSLNDSLQMTVALHNVGRVFKELGQYDRALSHLNISKQISEKIKDYIGIAYSDDEIGDVLLRKGEYDSAMTALMRSLKRTKELKEFVLEPKTLTKLATIYLHRGDFKTALTYYDSTNAFHEKTGNRFGIAEVELGRGLVYLKQNKYDEAQNLIGRSAVIAQEINARVLEIQCYNQLSYLWELKGDYKKSLGYFKRYKVLEDSLFSQETQEKLLRDQIRFETESKDSQIAALSEQQTVQKNELKKQEFVRNILVVVMALSVILLVTVYRSGQRRRQINTLLLQHQEETEKRSEELERLNQVKDKFFSIISHDLRSPINALAGMLNLIAKGAVTAEDMPKHIQELKARFDHTRTLLNNLLDWTLLQMDKLNLQATKIDLRKIVDENIQLLISIQDKQIKLTNNIPENALAFADSNTVNLVIRNLMTNAIKFTNDSGEVTIAAEEKPNEWLLSVKDNGIGMKQEVMDILFDKTAPYTTRGTANEKGTGLGLILCKEFVEKNGGKIWVESSEGNGSKFWFTLPKPS